nr:histone H2AX [Ipomoea batatas]
MQVCSSDVVAADQSNTVVDKYNERLIVKVPYMKGCYYGASEYDELPVCHNEGLWFNRGSPLWMLSCMTIDLYNSLSKRGVISVQQLLDLSSTNLQSIVGNSVASKLHQEAQENSDDKIVGKLHNIFANTLGRHGSGQRPDVQDLSLVASFNSFCHALRVSEIDSSQFEVGKYAERVAPVYLAVVLEYLAAEELELAGNAARDNKKNRIVPRHIRLALRNDEELSKLLGDVTIANGGVLPNIHQTLLPKKAGSGKGEMGLLLRSFRLSSYAKVPKFAIFICQSS